jgi:hypothetical protein
MGESDKTIEALRAQLVTEERKINLRAAQMLMPTGGSNQTSTSGGSILNVTFFGKKSMLRVRAVTLVEVIGVAVVKTTAYQENESEEKALSAHIVIKADVMH